ncbi:hypothetical protein IFM89_038301 [Coptis chinensis]|uniref:Pentatricopeptide repeat-containing protein n=1 Tax=Coptis chinensis TaxID=261450 RepID=A0A835H0F1_9MAGN|nr:hypothetical protein IFM89_038301 [Coptis chinensis]
MRLISLYGKVDMFDHSLKLFDELPGLNCKHTVLSFGALLTASVQSKKYDKTEKVFRELPMTLSITLNYYTYTIVIQAFCEMGSLESVLSMLDEMEKNGVRPKLSLYNNILDVFYSKAKRVYDALLENDFVPNDNTFEALVPCVCEKGDLDLALKLCEDSLSFCSYPDARVVQVVVNGLVKESKVEEARKLLELASKRKSYPVNLKMPQR